MEIPLYIAAGVLLLGAIAMVVTHVFGWSAERFSAPLRASTAEAGERTSDWAAEFWRWLRLGR